MEKKRNRVQIMFALTKYIKGFRKYLIAAVACNFIFKLLPLAISFLSSLMISFVVLGDVQAIPVMMLTVFLLVIMDALFSYLDILVSHDMTYRILTKLRDKAYDQINRLAPAIMVQAQSGDFISTIMEDIELLEWFYAHVIAQLIVAVAIPTMMLIGLGHLSIKIPIVIIPFIIVLLMIPKLQTKKSNEQGSEVRKMAGKLNAEVIDGVQGLKDIISFGWQKKYFERFSKTEEEYRKASYVYESRSALDGSLMNFFVEVAGLITDMVAIYCVSTGEIKLQYLLPIFILSTGIFAPIMEALTMSNNYGLIFGAAQRVLALLEKKSQVNNQGTITAGEVLQDKKHGMSNHLKLEGVFFHYPEENAEKNPDILKGVSFMIKQGETVALVGSSGSGKTTISRLLLRFWDTDAGAIKINDVDIKKIRLDELQKLITVVPQETYLFATTILENLKLAKQDATTQELVKAAQMAQADDFITAFPKQYNTELGERGLRLSGGEKKRIAIAQAMLKDAPFLILDEASANLDAENERKINRAIAELKKGKTTIMIAHRLSTIRSADRIILLQNGLVEAEGTFEELLRENEAFQTLIGEAS